MTQGKLSWGGKETLECAYQLARFRRTTISFKFSRKYDVVVHNVPECSAKESPNQHHLNDLTDLIAILNRKWMGVVQLIIGGLLQATHS